MAAGDLTVVGTMTANAKVSTPKLEGVTNTDVVTNLNADKVDGADRDTDGTLAANSDAKIPSQKAAKTYIDTKDAANAKLTGDQTVAGVKTFSSIPVLPASNPATDNQASRKAYVDSLDAANVKLTGNQTVAGIKTLSSIPVLPASDPTADNQATRKAYVNAQDALKANDNAVVKLTGNQTVAGVKTLSSIPVLPASDPTTDNQATRKAYVDAGRGIRGKAILTSGTAQNWQAPETGKYKVTVVGGGGGGGNATGDNIDLYWGTGGGGGGAAIRWYDLAAAQNCTYTVGAGGAASGDGGASTFTDGTTAITGGGGLQGADTVRGASTPGGAGGAGTNGHVNISGQAGQIFDATPKNTTEGGSSHLGFGARSRLPSSDGDGIAGGLYGGGGGGAIRSANGTSYGGVGAAGVIIIEW